MPRLGVENKDERGLQGERKYLSVSPFPDKREEEVGAAHELELMLCLQSCGGKNNESVQEACTSIQSGLRFPGCGPCPLLGSFISLLPHSVPLE